MAILRVGLTKSLYWRINKHDPPYFELASRQGWTIINPLCHFELMRMGDPNTVTVRSMARLTQNTVLVETSGIMFMVPFELATGNAWSDQTTEFIDTFLKHLRHAAKQADIAKDIAVMMVGTDLLSVPAAIFPTQTKEHEIYIKAYFVDTAITRKSIERADTTLVNDTLPVFGTLLLDAILAFIESDFRRSILYAAIAAETMASTKLEEIYKALLKNGDPAETIRLVALPPRGGIKDPIYEYLASKADFVQLIHQLPLYLLRRSLLIEDEELYQNARKLYATRNKIVHRGDVASDEKPATYLPINEFGAKKAIECAISLFRWYDITEEYAFPKIGFYRCNPVEIPNIEEQ